MTSLEQIVFGVGVFSISVTGLVLVWVLWAFLCDTAHTLLVVAEHCDRLSDRCQDSDRRDRIEAADSVWCPEWDRELAELLEAGA